MKGEIIASTSSGGSDGRGSGSLPRLGMPKSLRLRVPLMLLLLFLVLAALFMRVFGYFVLRGYEQLEQQNVKLDVERASGGIDGQIHELAATVGDWAPWDDTYDFMDGYPASYSEENLTPGTMRNLGVDYMAFVDVSGHVGHAVRFDRETGERVIPTAEMTGAAMRIAAMLKHSEPTAIASGTLVVRQGAAIIAAQNISDNDGKADPRGVLVVIRILEDQDVQRIRDSVLLDVSLTPVARRASVAYVRANADERTDAVYVESVDDSKIVGWTTREGFDGSPSFLISLVEPRPGHVHAVRTLEYSGWGIFAFIVCFGVGMSLTLDRTVLNRLSRLHSQVVLIESDPEAPKRVDEVGDDEITDFAAALNLALARVEETERALIHAADHDYLTELPNRRRFEQEADRELAERARVGGECSLALIDLDDFKAINDSYGHHCGDEVLAWLAIVMRHAVRSYCTVARLGGDEFAILMPHTPTDQAAKVLDRLRSRLEHTPCPCSSDNIWITVSVGLAYSPQDGTTLEELATVADKRLYEAKSCKSEAQGQERDEADWPG